MDQDQGVGREVKRLREARGWSQTRLAVDADMSVSGVSMIESGHRNLTTTTLAKLARALGVEVADLFPKGQPRLPDSLAIEDILERAGTKTRWGALSDDTWNARLGELSAAEAMQLYEQVQAERLATLELRHQLAREGTPTEKLFAARMWERYLVRTLRAAEAAGNELVIEEAFDGARRELVGASA
jgi:transcriptional regulator with XRE-family HTH domain